MARAGDVFELHDGETVTIQALTPTVLTLAAEWGPVPHKPPLHFHPGQDERFEVETGQLTVRMHDREHVLRAGDALDVPRGTRHAMWASEPTRACWQVRPALRTADFFEYVHEQRAAGHTGKGGAIDPLVAGLVLRGFQDEFRLALPAIVQRPLGALLAGLARLRGYAPPPRVAEGLPLSAGGGRS